MCACAFVRVCACARACWRLARKKSKAYLRLNPEAMVICVDVVESNMATMATALPADVRCQSQKA